MRPLISGISAGASPPSLKLGLGGTSGSCSPMPMVSGMNSAASAPGLRGLYSATSITRLGGKAPESPGWLPCWMKRPLAWPYTWEPPPPLLPPNSPLITPPTPPCMNSGMPVMVEVERSTQSWVGAVCACANSGAHASTATAARG